jgi:hypothetical protein
MIQYVPGSGELRATAKRSDTKLLGTVLAATMLVALGAGRSRAAERLEDTRRGVQAQVAQAEHGTTPRELQPRYEPVPPEPEPSYDASYIFALTRGVTASTMVPAAKAVLLPLTIPLDIVLLPFAAIGGLF